MEFIAYSGKEGCESFACRVLPNEDGTYTCIGWHCAVCDEPSSQYGHAHCRDEDADKPII